MAQDNQQTERSYGNYLKPEVKNVIRLTLAFTKAVGNAQKDKGDNLVVSPYNALACLSMVAEGSATVTREEFAKILFGANDADVGAEARKAVALNAEVLANAKDKITLATANAVWTNQNLVPLNPAYAANLKQDFGADVTGEDFNDPATVDKINQWASDNTNKLITEIVKELSPDDYAVLASALHFKAPWTSKFDKGLTEDKDFTKDGGDVLSAATMRQTYEEDNEVLRYQQGGDYEAVSLTYGERSESAYYNNAPVRIVLIRPTDDAVSARDWLNAQADGKVPAWLDNHAYTEALGNVELPRLDIKQKHDLKQTLEDMGLASAFNAKTADFSPMTADNSKGLFISEVTQDVVFKTDEEGSEGAAVTMAKMTLECAMIGPEPANIDIKFNRSFAFAVQDCKTGAPLFVGVVNQPSKEAKPKAPGL